MKVWQGNAGSNRNACPASVPTHSVPNPHTSRSLTRNRTQSTSGPGETGPFSVLLMNASPPREDQPLRSNTHAPAGMRPCRPSHASKNSRVNKNPGSAAHSALASITHAGATSRCGAIVSVAPAASSRPVTQWIGASKCVPISVIENGADGANGGGSPITGVSADKGCDRSTTLMAPEASAAITWFNSLEQDILGAKHFLFCQHAPTHRFRRGITEVNHVSAPSGQQGLKLRPSAHQDSFARDNLPPPELWPEMIFTLPELHWPDRLNCADHFIDRHLRDGRGTNTAIIGPNGERWTYAELSERVSRICNVLADAGLVPGNRVLLRAANTPMMVACYFAVLKAGGVVVASMPLLRAKELSFMIKKARISHALCDIRLRAEMDLLPEDARPRVTVNFRSLAEPAELETCMAQAAPAFTACDTAQDDVCLIGFTSGTTGVPKGTMHFHRDMLAICDTFSRHVLRPDASDLFLGSAPLAFTFGLGGSVLFPFRVGAAGLILERTSPPDLMAAIGEHRPSILFTAPTTYRFMLQRAAEADLSSLRKCVSAGEALPKSTSDAWFAATGLRLIDGIGGTEMLHIFISAAGPDIRPGATGRAVPGFEARVVDEDGNELPPGTLGRLAIRGPTGCRYLDDDRQTRFVQNGWNMTGDTYTKDEEGYFWYGARSDDMIVSSGYNIAGLEVEEALLQHQAVVECAVVGAPDPERGQIIKAYIVLAKGHEASDAMTQELQSYVRTTIAPYKYPRQIEYVAALPRTETGKIQRFRLRQMAQGSV
eukprot:gene5949-6022_t